MVDFISHYIEDLFAALKLIDKRILNDITEVIRTARGSSNTVFLIGNGGSSATPSHSAGDWTKELRLKTICLTDNASALTAFANDTDYSNIFAGQLETFLTPGDIVIGYSGSGNSQNILAAISLAKEKGNFTIGITGNYKGNQGGGLANLADLALVVQTESMERIEDIHLIINHIIKEYIKESSD